MRRSILALFSLAIFLLALTAVSSAEAQEASQEESVVLVVDPGQRRINVEQLRRSIERALSRPVMRLSDPHADEAGSRLMIAHQVPSRWVVRYEARGNVSWISAHIDHPGRLRAELAELSQRAVAEVERAAHGAVAGAGSAAGSEGGSEARPSEPPPSSRLAAPASRSEESWGPIVEALRDELIDPFEGEGRSRSAEPTAFLWSEILDPFSDAVPHTQPSAPEVWGEVLDPMMDPWSDD